MYFQEPGTCFPLQSFLQDVLFSNIMNFPQKKDFHCNQGYDAFGQQIKLLQFQFTFFEK